jgi:hypothetical protein
MHVVTQSDFIQFKLQIRKFERLLRKPAYAKEIVERWTPQIGGRLFFLDCLRSAQYVEENNESFSTLFEIAESFPWMGIEEIFDTHDPEFFLPYLVHQLPKKARLHILDAMLPAFPLV